MSFFSCSDGGASAVNYEGQGEDVAVVGIFIGSVRGDLTVCLIVAADGGRYIGID